MHVFVRYVQCFHVNAFWLSATKCVVAS